MSRYCACLVVLFAVAAIVASGDDLSNDLGEAVVETDRAVTALADIFYMRTSIACKIKCGHLLHQDNALYYTTCELLKPTKSCHHAIQPWLLYLIMFVALLLIGNCVVSCSACGKRPKIRYAAVDANQYHMPTVESMKAPETVVTDQESV